MKGEVCGEAKKGFVDRRTAEGSGVERSSEVVRFPPLSLFAVAAGGFPRSSASNASELAPSNQSRTFTRLSLHEAWDAQQVPSWSISRPFSDPSSEDDLGRVPSSPLAAASGLWSSDSTGTSLKLATTDSKAPKGQRIGMNRWKGDLRKQVSPNLEKSESVGAKADSTDSSFGSTLPKKSKNDFKLRTTQTSKLQFKTEKLPTTALKQTISLNNDGEMPIDVQQDMHHIRQTILEQEAVFREQVRELHRVYKVQTLLLAEMKKKDSDLLSLSSRTNLGGPSQSPSEFTSINSGNKRNSWHCAVGQVSGTVGQDYETSISLALPEPMKGEPSLVSEADVHAPLQEAKLFRRTDCIPRVRRTFDLERPPEDDEDDYDDDPERRVDENIAPIQAKCLKFMESHASCNEPESDVSLTLSTGWGREKDVKDSRDFSDKAEQETFRASKRPREAEEVALFPFLATKSEALLRNVPLRPTPTVATQSFLEGLWGLHLWRKQLSGASTSEKDVQQNLFSPGLRQVPSPSSREDLERHAEGSSKKVSQASETVQGNGRSPLGTDEWIEPAPMEQNHFCSPGGIDSSCEEEDGTLVKRLHGGRMELKKDRSPGGTYAVSLSHKDMVQPDDAAAFWITNQKAWMIAKTFENFVSQFEKANVVSREDKGKVLLLDNTLCPGSMLESNPSLNS